jgi:hypothetical protein
MVLRAGMNQAVRRPRPDITHINPADDPQKAAKP